MAAPGSNGQTNVELSGAGENSIKRGRNGLGSSASAGAVCSAGVKPRATGVIDSRDMRQTVTTARICLFAALLPVPVAAAAQAVPSGHDAHRLHRDSAAYIAALEDPARDAWQKPQAVLEALALREGEQVADIGAGSGYFAIRFAREVGPGGRVFAVDVREDMLAHLDARAKAAQLTNVRPLLASAADPRLADASVDRVFFCDVWHHIEDQAGYLERLKSALRPEGQIVMIDFHKRELPVGPPVSMKIAREDLVAQMERHGFRLAREHTVLPYQYFLVFTRK